jgi:hypothetical protein
MSSITWWNRVEPRPSTGDITSPLQAKLRDPLWMLARQWQLGEFLGADSGSPAWVQLAERRGALTTWNAPNVAPTALVAAPLEQQLEAEPFTPDLGTRIELGQILSRLLAEAGQADTAFLVAFPIAAVSADPTDAVDPVDAQLRRVCAGRAIDGVVAYQAIKTSSASLPSTPAATIQAFVTWVESTLGPIGTVADASTWQPAQLQYAAGASATVTTGTATLAITPGDDGLVEWSAFNLVSTTAGAAPATSSRSIVPAHVRFKGMPNARFWDFENGTLDFGDIKPDKRDLARLALMDFMLVHANDWFMLPIDLAVGGTYQLDSLLVIDVFGVQTLVARADRENLGPGNWTMFSTSQQGTTTTADFFLLPPSAGAALQSGAVLEDIRFARDDMANMAWAIENTLENAAGDPWPQRERDAALPATTTTSSTANTPLVYQLESAVPSYWMPFVPLQLNATTGAVALARAEAVDRQGNLIVPRGRVLSPSSLAGSSYQLPEAEVPRNGVHIQRFAARCRWTDGSTRLWQMRRSQPGTGETQSALHFDQASTVSS